MRRPHSGLAQPVTPTRAAPLGVTPHRLLTLQPEASYTTSTGLYAVVIYYSQSGGNAKGRYNTNFISGYYTQEQSSQYDVCATCSYSNGGVIYYCPQFNECSSAGTEANTKFCGVDSSLLYDACPTTPVNTTNGYTFRWRETNSGDLDGRSQDPYLILEEYLRQPDTQMSFYGYTGEWMAIGQHIASTSMTYGVSWSGAKTNTITNAWAVRVHDLERVTVADGP